MPMLGPFVRTEDVLGPAVIVELENSGRSQSMLRLARYSLISIRTSRGASYEQQKPARQQKLRHGQVLSQ